MTDKSTLIKLKESERDVRKNLIIDAAMALFSQKTFSAVSMRDIASEAGISPSSIYRYFSDRDELFVEAFFREGKKIGENIEEKLIKGSQNGAIELIAADFVDYLLQHDTFFQMMTYFMMEGQISQASLKRFNEAIENHVLQIFDEMFKKIGVTGNVRLTSHVFFAALNGILITFRKYPGRNREEVEKHIHRLAKIMAGIFERGAG